MFEPSSWLEDVGPTCADDVDWVRGRPVTSVPPASLHAAINAGSSVNSAQPAVNDIATFGAAFRTHDLMRD
jgi:hypothetical protein